jgi:glyoxylase-like metal-dependent hydrolase (beta-lactamase superfamily II)
MPGLGEVGPGALVRTAALYLTTTTVVLGPDGNCLVVDPGVTPAELALLAAELAGRGLRPVGGFSTHPHWDHLLWATALGRVPRWATAAAVAAARHRRAQLVDELVAEAPGHELGLFASTRPLPDGAATVPWAGPQTLVVAHAAHAPGHAALFVPAQGLLVAGDMCSDVEIPLLDLGSADPVADYRGGLDALAALDGVTWVVPGHGHPGPGAELLRRLDADRRYLDDLEAGRPLDDPRAEAPWLTGAHEAHRRRLRELGGR